MALLNDDFRWWWMTSDRKKPGVAFWATVGLVVVLVGYPLSMGPAQFWLVPKSHNVNWINSTIHTVYAPLWWMFDNSPDSIRAATGSYLDWWALSVELPPR